MQEWVNHRSQKEKMHLPLKGEMLDAIDRFLFNHYCKSFRSGAFARANCSMYVCLSRFVSRRFHNRLPFPKPDVEHARSVGTLGPSRAV